MEEKLSQRKKLLHLQQNKKQMDWMMKMRLEDY